MKNLILVIGRSGSGKDTLVRHAQSVFGASAIPSYTDRPKRASETEGVEHTFLTKDEFTALLEREEPFAYTQIGETGYRYCTTVEMLSKIDADVVFYVIDPKGYYFCKKFADRFNMKVVYVSTSEENRKERANLRNGDSSTWAKRTEDENAQFDEFEQNAPWDAVVFNNGKLNEAMEAFVGSVKALIRRDITCNRVLTVPKCDKDEVEETLRTLAHHYNVSVIAYAEYVGFLWGKIRYSIEFVGDNEDLVNQASDNLIALAKEHNDLLEPVTVTVPSLPIWYGDPRLF